MEDLEDIAALHAQSWRDHYRGVYSDAFLDGEAIADRFEVWGERLTRQSPDRFTAVAEFDRAVVGFAHVILDEHPLRGAVLQNLHIKTTRQRKGVGSRLVEESARTLLQRRAASGLHVWVREANTAAIAFYRALGGAPVDRTLGGPFADGSRAAVLCLLWPDPGRFTAST